MHFRDVSHYVSRTNQNCIRNTACVAPARARLWAVPELAHERKISLSNSDQFCAKLLTGRRPPGYGTLIDSLSFRVSIPTLWVVNKYKGGKRGDCFTAQFLLKNAGENCGQIHPQLLRCVSYLRLNHPLVMCHYLQTRPIAAGHRRWKAMTVLLRISDVQDRLCVSRSTVNRLIHDRKLECVYIGRNPRIPDDAVERFIKQLRDGTFDRDENEAQA